MSAYRTGSSLRPDLPLAVVIGAGGMSLVVARRLNQHHRVLICDIDGDRAEAGAAELRAGGGDATAVRCDITDEGDVAHLAGLVAERGAFRALAHVAGLSPSLASFETIVRVNLRGPALVVDALRPFAGPGSAALVVASLAGHGHEPAPAILKLLRRPRDPALVEVLAAAVGEAAATPQLAYQLSKYGVIDLCRREAAAWGARGARIVSLSPGLIASPQGAIEFGKSASKASLLARTPLAREGTMLEIADAAEFLLSARASFISGTDILVDGGLAGSLGG